MKAGALWNDPHLADEHAAQEKKSEAALLLATSHIMLKDGESASNQEADESL